MLEAALWLGQGRAFDEAPSADAQPQSGRLQSFDVEGGHGQLGTAGDSWMKHSWGTILLRWRWLGASRAFTGEHSQSSGGLNPRGFTRKLLGFIIGPVVQ